jgi:alcohol dehydrogenase class IV
VTYMKAFTYKHPSELRFGWGRRKEVGEVVASYGKRCLLVTVKAAPMEALFQEVEKSCLAQGVEIHRFDGVVPNPTTDSVNAGVELARSAKVDVVLAVGGGSSIDTAKAIAVGATHPGQPWDYRLYAKPISDKVLPIIALTTTSGTGAEVTPVSVVTNPAEQLKYALVHSLLIPRVAIIDPETTLTVPPHVTASTGFDAFCHCFESMIHSGANPYVDMHALEGIRLVAAYLERAVKDGSDREAREAMAWANTLGGLSITNVGVTLPHGIGMAIGGHAPHVMHGEALAITYPEIIAWTWDAAIGPFARAARILNPAHEKLSDTAAAKALGSEIERLQRSIGMWMGFADKNVPESALAAIADDTMKLPDYKAHPKVADRDFYLGLLHKCYAARR